MNKLLFNEGGQPLHLDDIAFLQESHQTVLGAILESIGDCVIKGAEIHPTGGYVSNGLIAYKGKLYQVVDDQTIPTFESGDESAKYAWQFSEVSEGEKTFEDDQERPTRLLRQARIVPYDPSRAYYDKLVPYNDLPRLSRRAMLHKPLAKATINGDGRVRLLDFVPLSRFLAVLTVRLEYRRDFDRALGDLSISYPDELYDVDLVFGDIVGVQGSADIPKSIAKRFGNDTLELSEGKFYLRRGDGPRGDLDADDSRYTFVTLTMIVSWAVEIDYLKDLG